ncbi:MAG: AAA family ATPase [Eubacteriales bacterium]|nr:AAA family ATPase [Eubacteriales bacterium]
MKTLYLIGGTMGVGKTATCRALQKRLPACVFLDADWCWDARPSVVTEETKAMVMDNITHLLNNFLRCSAYENVVCCWVLHQQAIWDELLSRLDLTGCAVRRIALIASEEALTRRLRLDVERGVREEEVIARSVQRLPLYDPLNVEKLDVSSLSPAQAAERIAP